MRKAARIAYAALVALLTLTLAVSSYAAFGKTVTVTGTMTLHASGASGVAESNATPEELRMMLEEATGDAAAQGAEFGGTELNTDGEGAAPTPEATPVPVEETPQVAQTPAQSFDLPGPDGIN